MAPNQPCACGHTSSPETLGAVGLTAVDAEALATVWTVLARVLAEAPTTEVLDSLRSSELLQDWPLLDTQHEPDVMAAGLHSLAESRRVGETASDVADDLMRLLRGPGSALAYPFESVHRSREGLVFEQETLQVRSWYARFGLEAPQLNRYPDDHIHLELEFCATLLRRATAALEKHDMDRSQMYFAAHRDFCQEHLLAWAPTFFSQLLAGASTHFYRGMAVLGSHALGWAEDRLALEVTSYAQR